MPSAEIRLLKFWLPGLTSCFSGWLDFCPGVSMNKLKNLANITDSLKWTLTCHTVRAVTGKLLGDTYCPASPLSSALGWIAASWKHSEVSTRELGVQIAHLRPCRGGFFYLGGLADTESKIPAFHLLGVMRACKRVISSRDFVRCMRHKIPESLTVSSL